MEKKHQSFILRCTTNAWMNTFNFTYDDLFSYYTGMKIYVFVFWPSNKISGNFCHNLTIEEKEQYYPNPCFIIVGMNLIYSTHIPQHDYFIVDIINTFMIILLWRTFDSIHLISLKLSTFHHNKVSGSPRSCTISYNLNFLILKNVKTSKTWNILKKMKVLWKRIWTKCSTRSASQPVSPHPALP